jgi:threonine dehydratase
MTAALAAGFEVEEEPTPAEPAVLPRYSASLAAGERVQVPAVKTVADALVSNMPGEKCFPVVRKNVDRVFDVAEEYVLKGMKLLLTEGKIFAEPSSCIGIGAVLQGLVPVEEGQKICFLISGGSAALNQIRQLEDVELS